MRIHDYRHLCRYCSAKDNITDDYQKGKARKVVTCYFCFSTIFPTIDLPI